MRGLLKAKSQIAQAAQRASSTSARRFALLAADHSRTSPLKTHHEKNTPSAPTKPASAAAHYRQTNFSTGSTADLATKKIPPNTKANASKWWRTAATAAVALSTTTLLFASKALAEEQKEIPHTETVYENEVFLAKREGSNLNFYDKNNQNCVLAFRIYAHDNRLESTAIDFTNTSEGFANFLKEVLDSKICGKTYIINANASDKSIFEKAGFSFEPAAAEKTARVATIEAGVLTKIPTKSLPTGFTFAANIDSAQHAERLMELAAGSGFLPEKVKDYMAKEKSGLLAMQQEHVTRATIFDANGRIVACCTVSNPPGRPGYIADTWVDEKAFGSKAAGTAMLYQQVGTLHNPTKAFNIIMPPGRVTEFENYGFKVPSGTVGVAFQAPGPHLARAFEWQRQEAISRLSPASKAFAWLKKSIVDRQTEPKPVAPVPPVNNGATSNRPKPS